MSDQDTYALRTLHCPEGCGYKITRRVAEGLPEAPCPRCGGSRAKEFHDDIAFVIKDKGVSPWLLP